MKDTVFVTILLLIPTVFVLLDLAEDRWSRRHGEAPPGDAPGSETFAFLALVFVVYGALQWAGTALAPSAQEMMTTVRTQAALLFRQPLDVAPLTGVRLALVCVVMFYLLGLWDYALHRWFSHNSRFFFTHEYHHLPNHVTVTIPGMAVRPFAVVTTFPSTLASIVSAYALLVLFRLPLWDLTPLKVLVLVHAFLLTTSHSSFLRRWWWVHHAMKWLALTTPQEHLLHHTVDLQGNYGNFTVLWDRVFGTYLDPERAENKGHALGLPYDQDFLGAITGGRLKLSRSLRRRLRVERFSNIDRD